MRLYKNYPRKLFKMFNVLIRPKSSYEMWADRSEHEVKDGYTQYSQELSNTYLFNQISNLKITSCLEIGCAAGTRIFPLASKLNNCHFTGIDINEYAISLADEYKDVKNVSNTRFELNNVLDLNQSKFHYELVFCWATLIYISPADIKRALLNISNLSTKYILLLEKAFDEKDSVVRKILMQIKGFPNWTHNYKKLLSSAFTLIAEDDIPKDVWLPGGGGAKLMLFKRSS
jgi:2-polyprenyl-3-methyl-5-hydroxy-6-metoxy-1,4-benzoquinol methylase